MNIVFVGNCQAHALHWIYSWHFGEALGQTICYVDAWAPHRDAEWQPMFARADLVVRQLFDGDTPVRLTGLRKGMREIRFPNVRGDFLFPYGSVPRPDNPVRPYRNAGPYDPEVGDTFLNRMVRQEVPPEEALAQYLAHDIAAHAGLPRLYDLTMAAQRRRDAEGDIEIADFIDARLTSELLFHTPGHLSLGLFRHLAQQIYRQMGLGEDMIEKALRETSWSPFEGFHEAPLHPGVIDHYGLKFADRDTRYHHLQEGAFTFDERVLRYMRCDWVPELHEGCSLVWDAPDRALVLLDRALPQVPGSAHAHYHRALALKHLGRPAEGAVSAAQAFALAPERGDYRGEMHHLRHIAGLSD